jgi:hypothetical protein
MSVDRVRPEAVGRGSNNRDLEHRKHCLFVLIAKADPTNQPTPRGALLFAHMLTVGALLGMVSRKT